VSDRAIPSSTCSEEDYSKDGFFESLMEYFYTCLLAGINAPFLKFKGFCESFTDKPSGL